MNKKTVRWDTITELDEIPEITKSPGYMQLFMFSAITWNRHLIHYNKDYAQHDGLPDVAVHRALLGNYLTQLLTDWIGESGKISKIEWTVRSSVQPGEKLYCRGNISKKRKENTKRIIDCKIRIEKENGTLIAPGKATIVFFN